jgi:tryptophanyl-tRNA synthetase
MEQEGRCNLRPHSSACREGAFVLHLGMVRYLTGFQPTGSLHIGNYFGALRPAIELQNKGEAFYFIADFHALTTIHDPKILRELVRGVAIDSLACGLDPKKACFFRQSDIPSVAELSWILSTVTPMGLLERAHSYKDKLAHGISPTHALFAYPSLMAADILLYESDIVPVGKDQKQHLEITRDVAVKFNELYGSIFKLPIPEIRDEVATVIGLDGQKMSKSYGNTIGLFLEEKVLRKKIMSIVTDSTPVEAPKDPAASTIVSLYRLFATPKEVSAMEEDFRAGGFGYGDFKGRLFEIVWERFAPMRRLRDELLEDPGYINKVLAEGATRAREVAEQTISRVRNAVGLGPPARYS